MARRPCLDCGNLHRNPSRCDLCQSKREAKRGSSAQRGYGQRWRAVSAKVLQAHLAEYGAVCPGYLVPGHASVDLTVDHVIPKALGGSDDPANLTVLCRGCNSRKRDRHSPLVA